MKKLKKRKIVLRLFSFLFSLFIWMYVVSSEEIELEKLVPITVEAPKGYSFIKAPDNTQVYRIKGPRVFAQKFLEDDLKINVTSDIYYKSGEVRYKVSLERFQYKLPLGVELVQVEPRYVDLELERSLTKKVPIKLNLDPKIQKELKIEKVSFSPNMVEVSGPRTLVKRIKEVKTQVIEDGDQFDGKPITVSFMDQDSRVKLGVNSSIATYSIKSKLEEFTFSSIPIIFQSTKLIKNSSHSTVSLKVVGDSEVISNLNKDVIQVFANVPARSTGRVEVELLTELPEGIKVMEMFPSKVIVNLEK